MTMLSKQELTAALTIQPPLVEQMIDPAVQTQPNGVEMTLQSVHSLQGPGSVAFDNSERQLPDTEPLEFDSDGWLHLGPGIYKIIYNEVVNIPDGLAAIARARSSLLRCGVAAQPCGFQAEAQCQGRTADLFQAQQ